MKPIINFIFSIGYRCYSSEFLNNFKLKKMSSPFDYLFIDFETSLKNWEKKVEIMEMAAKRSKVLVSKAKTYV